MNYKDIHNILFRYSNLLFPVIGIVNIFLIDNNSMQLNIYLQISTLFISIWYLLLLLFTKIEIAKLGLEINMLKERGPYMDKTLIINATPTVFQRLELLESIRNNALNNSIKDRYIYTIMPVSNKMWYYYFPGIPLYFYFVIGGLFHSSHPEYSIWGLEIGVVIITLSVIFRNFIFHSYHYSSAGDAKQFMITGTILSIFLAIFLLLRPIYLCNHGNNNLNSRWQKNEYSADKIFIIEKIDGEEVNIKCIGTIAVQYLSADPRSIINPEPTVILKRIESVELGKTIFSDEECVVYRGPPWLCVCKDDKRNEYKLHLINH